MEKLSIRENGKLYLNGTELHDVIYYNVDQHAGDDAILTVKLLVKIEP